MPTRVEVAELREAGWTQAEIADGLGLSKGAVWRACQPGADEPAGNGRSPARRAESERDPQPDGLVVFATLVVVAVMAGVWLWGRWRRRTNPPEPDGPAGLAWPPPA